MKKMLLLTSIMTAFSGIAYSQETSETGLFVEPMVTWERGRGDVNFPAPFGNASTELDGFGIGARFGMHVYESFFIAADGRYSMPTFKDDRLNQDADAKAWNVGPVVGVQMPTLFGLRVWGGWIVAGELDPDKSQGVDEKFESGQGYRVGAGIKLSIVSLNIEYQKLKYDKTRLEQVGIFTTNQVSSSTELDNDSMILSVSFPLAI
ncbi:MAG: hypothetical protein K2Q18_13210 [Bdellovibrionales bacterium]|nr:hypothetical protein [Bdellovibrionales bacterium]